MPLLLTHPPTHTHNHPSPLIESWSPPHIHSIHCKSLYHSPHEYIHIHLNSLHLHPQHKNAHNIISIPSSIHPHNIHSKTTTSSPNDFIFQQHHPLFPSAKEKKKAKKEKKSTQPSQHSTSHPSIDTVSLSTFPSTTIMGLPHFIHPTHCARQAVKSTMTTPSFPKPAQSPTHHEHDYHHHKHLYHHHHHHYLHHSFTNTTHTSHMTIVIISPFVFIKVKKQQSSSK